MKTLVIHPDDRSTDFLKVIYEGKGYTVINDRDACRSRKVITNLIRKHDRIMMMGHGHPRGLFFTCIDSNMVYLLRQKECVCIWCNADKFVEKYGLVGFYTGMFISEVGEARYFSINATQEEVDHSNMLFVENLRNVLDKPTVLTEIKELYQGESPVIQFNNDRLYHRDTNDIIDEVLTDHYVDMVDDMLDDEDDIDPAGGHGLQSHV